MKFLNVLALTSLMATPAFASVQQVKECLKVYGNSVSACSDSDQKAGRCTETPYNETACITYENTCDTTLSCNVKGTALLAEPAETGFTKEILDRRTEKLFPLQQHRFCFNFDKDSYFLWNLQKIGKPSVDCEASGSPVAPCDPTQASCGTTPNIDMDSTCSPFDWTCS